MPAPPQEARVIHPADLDLVQRAMAREPRALRHLAHRSACIPGFLRSRASRLGMRLHDAALDDLVQETYLALWAKLSTYRGEARLETWACGFAFVQLRRWRASGIRDHLTSAELVEEPAQEAALPDDTVEVVERALDQLGPPADDVIRLKHFEDLTFEGIARRLRMSPNTAKSHYYRGLARLRGWLGSGAEGWTE